MGHLKLQHMKLLGHTKPICGTSGYTNKALLNVVSFSFKDYINHSFWKWIKSSMFFFFSLYSYLCNDIILSFLILSICNCNSNYEPPFGLNKFSCGWAQTKHQRDQCNCHQWMVRIPQSNYKVRENKGLLNWLKTLPSYPNDQGLIPWPTPTSRGCLPTCEGFLFLSLWVFLPSCAGYLFQHVQQTLKNLYMRK